MTAEPLAGLAPEQRRLCRKHLATCPVRIGALAAELGVAVRASSLAGNASGVVLCDGAGGGCIIRVERREARNRQRYTIALGLAHVLLHRGIIERVPDGIRINALHRSGEGEEVDRAAHLLAAGILMPRGQVKARTGKFAALPAGDLVSCMAAALAVTPPTMAARLEELGIA